MFERILWCLLGSFGVWMALVYLTSEGASQGRALSVVAFYADAVVAIVAFAILLFVFVLPVWYLRCLEPLAGDSVAVIRTKDMDLWPPTTVAHLENLKCELLALEERAHDLRTREFQVRKRQDNNAGGFELWLAERGLSILRHQYRYDSSRATALTRDIDRIYSGDVDHEILNFQEQITELRIQRNSGDPDSLITQWINDGLDRKIRLYERNITELRQWQKKVAAATESPYESAWRNFLDMAKRNAAAPIVEATSRVKAAFAGIEAKRYFEQTAAEEWRSGRLSEEELAYIRQRIREEFLNGAKHVST